MVIVLGDIHVNFGFSVGVMHGCIMIEGYA